MANNAKCREELGIEKPAQAWYMLRKMADQGRLRQVGQKRWARYVLP